MHDRYTFAKDQRKLEWVQLTASHKKEWDKLSALHEKISGIFETQRKEIDNGHKELQTKKETLAKENGRSDAKDSDILDINAGGGQQTIRVSRGTLTQIKGSTLEHLFSGRWDKQLQRDSKGRIFLDVNPDCFKSIVDYLKEYKIAPPDHPPELPTVDDREENKDILDGLLMAFGLDDLVVMEPPDSVILTSENRYIKTVTDFLKEDGVGNGLSLLYRGSRDGMTAASFHQKCDNQGPTVTLVKSSENYIFGGFSDKDWVDGWVDSNKAFLFGLFCHGGQEPVKMRLNANRDCYAMFCPFSGWGARFGVHDLATMYEPSSRLGHAYERPPGGHKYYFTGSYKYEMSEIEVFKVETLRNQLPPASSAKNQLLHQLAFDDFPDDIQKNFRAEKDALVEASNKLDALQHSFNQEQAAVGVFLGGKENLVAVLNVSGHTMAVNHSTLAKYPDSALYHQIADPKWNSGKGHHDQVDSPRRWGSKDVVAWAKKIDGLSENVDQYFEHVTGAELLVLHREDIKHLGIKRPGTVALIADAVQKLHKEEEESSATFIEHSEYCFGKIIDHMRLRAITIPQLGLANPAPPKIRKSEMSRFKCLVEFYFPDKEDAKHFLGDANRLQSEAASSGKEQRVTENEGNEDETTFSEFHPESLPRVWWQGIASRYYTGGVEFQMGGFFDSMCGGRSQPLSNNAEMEF